MPESTAPPCTFCRLIETDSANFVAQRDHAVAFAPLAEHAISPGHTLVAPRTHTHDGVLDIADEGLIASIRLVQEVGQAMLVALGATGVCVLNASGPGSGRSVHHLHWHVVPRYPGDPKDTLPWPPGRSPFVVEGDPYSLLHQRISTSPES